MKDMKGWVLNPIENNSSHGHLAPIPSYPSYSMLLLFFIYMLLAYPIYY
jgi:hypothetical protein